MGKHLLIVESPAKAKTINKFLGNDYIVKASMGHVRDLPEHKFGVDIENGFEPEYVVLKTRQKAMAELKAAAAKCDDVYLAPDPDREGEAIAWHLKEVLKGAVAEDRFFRVTYNEITAQAIRRAIEHPGQIDMHRVDAQQARRVLDRLVGYRVSPLLWRRIRGGSSAGRVQTVALRLVCEREQAIAAFVPEEFWILGALVAKQVDPKDPFPVRLARIDGKKAEIRTSEEALAVKNDLEGCELAVKAIIRREVSKRAMPPYITSTLQQAGARVCGFSTSRTMKIAQALYEGSETGGGLITYMRTDSVAIAREAQEACRAFVAQTYGDAFVPEKPNVYKSRGSAQEAHEAIRPTDVTRTPESLADTLKPEELRLYRIIWQRFVASQMAPARIAQVSVEVEAVPGAAAPQHAYLFRATASEVVFPGYMKVTGEDKKKAAPAAPEKDKEGDEAAEEELPALPPLAEGESLDRRDWLSEQKFTQPPGRYSEATLVKALEENGIGRPSTYAQIITTLFARKYIDQDKRALVPTSVGTQVNGFLVENLNELFDVQFTAHMEESLDGIEEGKVTWRDMLKDFNVSFERWLLQARGPAGNPDEIQALLTLAESIQEWQPARQAGKRTYSDQKFVDSIRTQAADGKKPLSQRQVDALKKVLVRYRAQIPEYDQRAVALSLPQGEEAEAAAAPPLPPREHTVTKMRLLAPVTFEAARKVGKRTYDDKVFFESLRKQVEQGRRLSENQIKYLDRLVTKYKDQIEGYDLVTAELELGAAEAPAEGAASGPSPQAEACRTLLEKMEAVTEWKPPTQRGRRMWDDREFYQSLKGQFAQKKALSDKQLGALRKMASRYGVVPKAAAPGAADEEPTASEG